MNYNFLNIKVKENESKTFLALKLSPKDKEEVSRFRSVKTDFVPCVDVDDKGKFFIYGLGWRKLGVRNRMEIPHFDINKDDINEYFQKYGIDCLYFSLTGKDYRSSDCCTLPMQYELCSMFRVKNIKDYFEFVDVIKKIQNIQTNVIENDKDLVDWEKRYYLKDTLISVRYRMYLMTTPHLNCIDDDVQLEKYYRAKRKRQLIKEKLYSYYDKNITTTIDKEIEDGVFPISLQDRLTYLFGKECSDLYKKALDYVEKF